MALAITLLADARLVFGAGTTLTATFSAIAAGTILVVNTQFYLPGGVTCVISDSASDTVTDSGLGTLSDGANTAAFSQAFLNPTAGVTSVTATLGGQSEVRMLVYAVTGFTAGTAAFDKTASSTANTSSPNSGTTATLSQADEAVFGFAANQNNPYSSMDASFIDEGSFQGGFFSTNGGHKVVSATTAVSYSGTAAGAVPDIIFVVTIKGTLSGGAVVEAEPHFIGRMAVQPIYSMLALRQNQASDTSGPLGVQPETNTHFIGRFKPPTMSVLQSYRQNPWFTSGPLPLQPETNTHFVGKFNPPSVFVLRGLRENPWFTSGPLPIQPETNTHFIGKFRQQAMAVLQGLRQNPAADIPTIAQAETNTHFVGRFVQASNRVLRSLRENTANDTSSSVVQPETNTHFVGRFTSPVNWLLRSLRENQASDASSLALQPSTNVHYIGKFVQTAINLLPALRQNQANDFFAAAPFDNPTHFVGKFTPPMLSVLRSLRENTANDSSTLTTQADTATHFIGRFTQTAMRVSPDLRQNQATDLASVVKQIFDWLVTARRRGRR